MPNYQEIVGRILSSPKVRSGWYESGDQTFSFESTHVAKLDGNVFDEKGADFIISLVGMLRGLRLQREGWQHLRRTPVAAEKLCDFHADYKQMEKAIEIATTF